MLKRLLTLATIFIVIGCGNTTPSDLGVYIPDDNNTPIESIADTSDSSESSEATMGENNENEIGAVKVFNAPLVLVRGVIPQHPSVANVNPGT